MAFPKGKSGNPGGRPKERHWRDALSVALHEDGDGGKKKLRLVAEAVVNAAIAGDMQAAKEIGDRLDGKPSQQIEHTGDPEQPVELAFRWLSSKKS